ncbi:MAG TPA: hypothetical protein PKA10_14155 [Selenomonadales bacterium]|nr:hypothetical protein [Selenomonadales bacterium]
MKQLFKQRMTRMGSLISLITVTALLALFSLALPEFLASFYGRVFAVVWASMAILTFIAHARRMSEGHRRYIPYFSSRIVDDRTAKKREERRAVKLMRG